MKNKIYNILLFLNQFFENKYMKKIINFTNNYFKY